MQTNYFGTSGLLARHLPNYEDREGQVLMAKAVEKALLERRHLLVEAGTGTGKSFGYLAPCVDLSARLKLPIIISTGTKALQEQLMKKDVIFLKERLGLKFTVVNLKGRGNYACKEKIQNAMPYLDAIEQAELETIQEWLKTTTTGDIAELKTMRPTSRVWEEMNAKQDTCKGKDCPLYDSCFVTQLKERAKTADIIITNHHLFFADLNARMNSTGEVLPAHHAVVFDEAHLLEGIASDFFGMKISKNRINIILSLLKNIEYDEPSLDVIREYADIVFAPQTDDKIPDIPEVIYLSEMLHSAMTVISDQLLGAITESKSRELYRAHDAINEFVIELNFIFRQKDDDYVFWAECRPNTTIYHASIINVGVILRKQLFTEQKTTVLTSATLTANNGFGYIKKRIGLRNSRELIAESPFNYDKQAILYLPNICSPKDARFLDEAAEHIIELLYTTKGRTFVLCTSVATMNTLWDKISPNVFFPMFKQGDMSTAQLLANFKKTPNAVLFGLNTFWEGVDIQGDDLISVIITKLPFAVPTAPVVKARMEQIEREGGQPFFEYSVPQAIIMLKQGFGRLIRSRTDRGVVTILDNRLSKTGYGKLFLRSLPRTQITADLEDVEYFLCLESED